MSRASATLTRPGADRRAASSDPGFAPRVPVSAPAGRFEREARRPAAALPAPVSRVRASGAGTRTAAAALVPGGGRPLDRQARALFEARLGHSFGAVRVHDDGDAAGAAARLNAEAFTVGADIVFGAGAYRPGTAAGRALLEQELIHTLQQGGAPAGVVQRQEKPSGLGSAPPAEPFTVAEGVGTEDGHVTFGWDSATLAPAEVKALEKLIAPYRTPVAVEVHGYASGEGPSEYNINLSAHRAVAVKAWLLANLPPGSTVTVYARGETRAFGVRARNRRAGVDVMGEVPPAAGVGGGSEGGYSLNPRIRQRTGWDFRLTLPPLEWPGTIPAPTSTPALTSSTQPAGPTSQPGLLPSSLPAARYGVEPLPPDFWKLPPLTGPAIDWDGMRTPFTLRGLRLSDRDIDQIGRNWRMAFEFGRSLGLSVDNAASLANLGTAYAYDKLLAREHPAWTDVLQLEHEKLLGLSGATAPFELTVPLLTPTTLNMAVKALTGKDVSFKFWWP